MKPENQNNSQGLLRAIGVWGLAASIFNCTVGGGIFRLPGIVYAQAGTWTPITYLICASVILLIGLCFAQVGKDTLKSGGPYAYVGRVFGPYVGFLAGVLMWLLGTLSMASVATAFADNLGRLLPVISSPATRAAALLLTFSLIAAINVRGVTYGSLLTMVSSVAKLIPLLVLVGVGVFFIRGSSLAIQEPFEASTIARTCMLLIFAFSGVECALAPSGEFKQPEKTVPRALLLGLGGVTVLYIAIQLVAQGVLGPGLAQAKGTPLADVAEVLMGPAGRTLLLVGAVLSMFGYLTGMTLAMPRALYAFAEDRILPSILARISPSYRTPMPAIICHVGIVWLLAISSTFERLAIIANLSAVLLYVLCALGAWALRWHKSKFSWVPFLAVISMGWLLTSIQWQEWAACGSVLLVASGLYFLRRKERVL